MEGCCPHMAAERNAVLDLEEKNKPTCITLVLVEDHILTFRTILKRR